MAEKVGMATEDAVAKAHELALQGIGNHDALHIASAIAGEADLFVAAVSRDRPHYTEWRREGLPEMTIDAIAQQANALTEQFNAGKHD